MKPTQDFTAQNLFFMKGRRIPESLRARAPRSADEWLELARDTEAQIVQGSFRFSGLFASSASGKPALSTASPADALVLRKINDNIRRAYGIRQAQRSASVRLARTALSEWPPKGVVSLDLKSCFESITPKRVIDKLRDDARVSSQTVQLLEMFLSQATRFGANMYTRGLPRGILVSSTLAELYLTALDEKIKSLTGVYVYIRYVDDILVIASREANQLAREVFGAVNDQDLQINRAKSRVVDVGCKCDFTCNHPIGQCPCRDACKCTINGDNLDFIDYLGYRLIFGTGQKTASYQKCHAMVAPRKAKKIKKRVALSIHSYKQKADFELLEDRLRYLTSNLTIDQTLTKRTLRSGISHTFDQYHEPDDLGRFADCSLASLDRFARTKLRLLFAKRNFSYMERRRLRRNSFKHGHANFHRASFQRERIDQIKECWIDEVR